MIKKFFLGLNSSRVSYLLISGQATILYGAATFSEDIDLWVEPGIDNWNKFLKLLNDTGARAYKLTPPISMEFIQKGHGFHFQFGPKKQRPPSWFLDVLGIAPRAGNFEKCYRNVIYHKTDWGRIPVIGIRDLVEIKKTRRLQDYPIISNLVRIEYEKLSIKKIKSGDWRWILTNSFNVEDILYYLNNHYLARHIAKSIKRPCMPYCLKSIAGPKRGKRPIDSASMEIALEIETLRQLDRKYWEPVINELKRLKERNQLLVPGSKPPESVI